METDVEGLIGAGRHERSAERLNYRNGYRDRTFDTRLGPLSLRIPKLRQGSHFPPFLEPRKTAEKALVAVIQEAWIGGVSTRRGDDLGQAMGLTGISKSQASKLCKDIAARVRLEQGGTSIPWKVAFDEEFAAFSPGKQLMCDETRRWLADPKVERVDPVCEEDNGLMAPLWPDREAYGTLMVSSRRWGLGARLRAGMVDLKRAGRETAKRLL